MRELFNPDGKIMHYGRKLAYLMWIQLLTLLCCIPLVTIGASVTAMHKVLLQVYRNQEGNITKTFFGAFISNFTQATVIWVGYLVMLVALYLDYRLTANATSYVLLGLRWLVPVALILMALVLSWVFVLQSRYQNSILGTLRLSVAACIAHPLYTVFSVALMCLPAFVLALSWRLAPFVFFFGFTAPGLLRATLYSKIFDDLEDTDWRKEADDAECD